MNHITRQKRADRLMWTIWAICVIALLSALSNWFGLPVELPSANQTPFAHMDCVTDSECGCIDCLDSAISDNITLSIKEGE